LFYFFQKSFSDGIKIQNFIEEFQNFVQLKNIDLVFSKKTFILGLYNIKQKQCKELHFNFNKTLYISNKMFKQNAFFAIVFECA